MLPEKLIVSSTRQKEILAGKKDAEDGKVMDLSGIQENSK